MLRITALAGLMAVAVLVSACGTIQRTALPRPPVASIRDTLNVTRWQQSYDPKTNPYTVMGRTYYPISDSRGYSKVGIASWYGADFHNKTTASGDVYDMNAISAAHKTLPLGTVVRVTNLSNGRSVDMLINDRGPFVGDRLIDLSVGAAKALGSYQAGLARVRVTAIGSYAEGAPGTAYANAPTAAYKPVLALSRAPEHGPPAARSQAWPRAPRQSLAVAREFYVQVATFAQPANACRLRDRFIGQGFAGTRIKVISRGGHELHIVQVGVFTSLNEARDARSLLQAEFPESFIES